MSIDKSLYKIAFETIGLANIDLIKEIIIGHLSNEQITEKIHSSHKSDLCFKLSNIFQNVFAYSETHEPTPNRQYDMTNFKNKSFDLIEAIKIASVMFIKGMHDRFWELMNEDLIGSDYKFITGIEKISEHSNATMWVFVLLWKYLYSNDRISEKNNIEELFKMGVETNHLNLKVENKSSDYFYVHKSEHNLNLYKLIPDDINISRIDKDNYKISRLELGEDMISSKYTIEEILRFNTAKTKNLLHLSDLGTLQIPDINSGKRASALYCWFSSQSDPQPKRYILNPHSTKDLAFKINESDNLMSSHIYEYEWSFSSKVICIAECIDVSRVIDKKCYYTISLALPYSFPLTSLPNWKTTPIGNQIKLINIIKYIFGIPDRTIKNCGIYIFESKLRVCAYDFGPALKDLKSINGKIELSKSEENWLINISNNIDKKYSTRLCEIITHSTKL